MNKKWILGLILLSLTQFTYTMEQEAEKAVLFASVPEHYQVKFAGKIDPFDYFAVYVPTENHPEMLEYTQMKALGDRASSNPYHNLWKIKFGPKDNLKEYKVFKVEEIRDGGTAIVDTELGQFYFPSPLRPNDRPRLKHRLVYSHKGDKINNIPNENEKATLISNLPANHKIEYAGNVDDRLFFIIYSPNLAKPEYLPHAHHSFDLIIPDWQAKFGYLSDLKDIQVFSAKRSVNDPDLVTIDTSAGKFVFVDSEAEITEPLLASYRFF